MLPLAMHPSRGWTEAKCQKLTKLFVIERLPTGSALTVGMSLLCWMLVVLVLGIYIACVIPCLCSINSPCVMVAAVVRVLSPHVCETYYEGVTCTAHMLRGVFYTTLSTLQNSGRVCCGRRTEGGDRHIKHLRNAARHNGDASSRLFILCICSVA